MLRIELRSFDPSQHPPGGQPPVAMIPLTGRIAVTLDCNVHQNRPQDGRNRAFLTQSGKHLRIVPYRYVIPGGSPDVVMPALVELGAKARDIVAEEYPREQFDVFHILYGTPSLEAPGRFVVYFGFAFEGA